LARYSRRVVYVEWSKPLTPVTREKLLELCRTASYTLLLSNNIRRDVLLVNRYPDGYTVTFNPRRLRGLRMDEESCTGLIRRAILRGGVRGVVVRIAGGGGAPPGCCTPVHALRSCCSCIRLEAPVVAVQGVEVYTWFLAAAILMKHDVVCGSWRSS